MIHVKFTDEVKKQLHYERYNHPHPRVQQKMEVLLLKSKNLSHELICDIAEISPNTMRAYFKNFKQGGIEKLKEMHFYKPESELKEYADTIEGFFQKNLPRTSVEAAAKIEELTGIKRSLPRVRHYLKSIGMSFRKVGTIPGKAITDEKKRNRKNS